MISFISRDNYTCVTQLDLKMISVIHKACDTEMFIYKRLCCGDLGVIKFYVERMFYIIGCSTFIGMTPFNICTAFFIESLFRTLAQSHKSMMDINHRVSSIELSFNNINSNFVKRLFWGVIEQISWIERSLKAENYRDKIFYATWILSIHICRFRGVCYFLRSSCFSYVVYLLYLNVRR